MALLIHKYGGTSVGSTGRILSVAARLKTLRDRGHDIVVVVSAMGDTTDDLLALAAEITETPHRREMDMLLTAGERISMALLSMALNAVGCPAISFTGSQSGIITDSGHGRARILDVRPIRIREELSKGRVVIVAGFQGVSAEKEVTTLGRGGSDTSAVALAVAFKAAECAIYTDVDGVFTADPRIVPGARLLQHLDFDTALEFSSRGAGVVNFRAIELARKYRMPILVLNSVRDAPGTRIDGEASMENRGIVGVTANERVVSVHLSGLKVEAQALGDFVKRVGALGLDPGGFHQFKESPEACGCTFFVSDLPENARALEKLKGLTEEVGGRMNKSDGLGAVSVVAGGVINVADVAGRALACLSKAGVVPGSFLAGTLSLTFLVPRSDVTKAVQALHREVLEA